MNRYFNLQDKQIENYSDSLKYLLMGSSHNTINPEIVPLSFNYATPNENFIKNYYKLKDLIERRKIIPEYLIMNMELPLFSPFASERFKYDSYWIRYVDYFEVAKIKNDNDYIYMWFEGNFFSYVGKIREILMTIYYWNFPERIIKGYRQPVDSKNFANKIKRTEFARQRAELYLSGFDELDENMVMYFNRIMDLCREYNIKVIFLKMPVTEEYYLASFEVADINRLNKDLKGLTSEYNDMAIVLDYESVFFDNPDFFYNPDHLNPEGADSVSRLIKTDLEKLDKSD